MVLDLLEFAVFLFLILFGLTLVFVGGLFVLRIARECFRAKPFAAFEKKAAAAIQAADLGWLAIICGPLLGVFLLVPAVLISLCLGPPPKSVAHAGLTSAAQADHSSLSDSFDSWFKLSSFRSICPWMPTRDRWSIAHNSRSSRLRQR
jgi:hypothetical protein